MAKIGSQLACESVPQGGTLLNVWIGTLRRAPFTLSTLQMYSFWTGDQVL